VETEELYDNELIDEIANEVLLALEEERHDVLMRHMEACQAELAQLLSNFSTICRSNFHSPVSIHFCRILGVTQVEPSVHFLTQFPDL
jgi:hypothetical protein